jgi:hypothetical protein
VQLPWTSADHCRPKVFSTRQSRLLEGQLGAARCRLKGLNALLTIVSIPLSASVVAGTRLCREAPTLPRALPGLRGRLARAHSVPSACPSVRLLTASGGLTRCPRLARASSRTQWIRQIKLVPKLTVRFDSRHPLYTRKALQQQRIG